jgi:hypothetical protein
MFTVSPAPQRRPFTRDSIRRKTMAPPVRFSDVVPASVLVSITPDELQRQEVVFELIKTEESYITDMKMTIDVFLNPIRDNQMLSKAQVSAVFSNLEALVPVNQSILAVRGNTYTHTHTHDCCSTTQCNTSHILLFRFALLSD